MGPRLAALVVDASEDMREREETSLEQLLAGSRILVGAVSHEVRNVCGAIAVIHENLVRSGVLSGQPGFRSARLAGRNPQPDRLAGAETERRPARRPAASTCSRCWTICGSCSSRIARMRTSSCGWEIPGKASAGLGRPAQAVAGAAQPDQEQRARPRRRGREANRNRRRGGTGTARDGPGHRFGARHRPTRSICFSRSRGAPALHRPGPVSLARFHALVSWRLAARSCAVPGCSFVIELAGPPARDEDRAWTRSQHMEPNPTVACSMITCCSARA